MRGPRLADFRLDVRKPGTRGRCWNADEMIAGRTLNLASGMAGIALQRLVAVGTIGFELGGVYRLRLNHAPTRCKKYFADFFRLPSGWDHR